MQRESVTEVQRAPLYPFPLDEQDPSRMAAAEAVLALHLRDAPHALAAAQHILARSTVMEARLHAALGLKRAAAIHWAGMASEEVGAASFTHAAGIYRSEMLKQPV